METFSKLAHFHACTKAKISFLSPEECQVFVPWASEPVAQSEMLKFADALQGTRSYYALLSVVCVQSNLISICM
jgi:hypothetical protein